MTESAGFLTDYISKFFIVIGAEWVLYLLLLLSVVSLFVMIERFRALAAEEDDLELLSARIRQVMRSQEGSGGAPYRSSEAEKVAAFEKTVEKELERFTGMAARVAREGLKVCHRGIGAADEAMNGCVVREKLRLERNTAFLGTLGNNAPFIGLFGTVLGVMKAFQDLGLAGAEASTTTVMSGISEALVATAVGLFVALPAVMVYNLLQRRIKSIATGAQVVSHTILSELKGMGAENKEA